MGYAESHIVTLTKAAKRCIACHNRSPFAVIVTALAVACVLTLTGVAHAATTRAWHTCTPMATRRIDGLEYHLDAYGTSQRSCITVKDGRLTIDTDYQPVGGSVVAYDAIEFGDYPFSRDPGWGIPAPITRVHTTVRVSISGGPGYWLGDSDIWYGRTSDTTTVSHVREMIIATRWNGYGAYCDPYSVKVGSRMDVRLPPMHVVVVAHRRWRFGACMTGGAGHAHLLIRFLAVRQSPSMTLNLAAFTAIAHRHHWLTDAMSLESVSFAPEVWEGAKGVTYSMQARS